MKKLLIDVTPLIQTLELTTKSTLGGELLGSYKSRFRGRGIEFDEYSEYTPTDDAKLIDWKASTKANKLLIKEYIEERNLSISFLINVSNSMIYTTGKKLKAEYTGELLISLAFMMIKNADQVGFTMFSDKIVREYPPKGGIPQYYIIIDNLLNAKNYGGGCDFNNALIHIFSYAKPKSMVILLTDFISLKPGWEDIIKGNSKKFDIIVFMIRDPADWALPPADKDVILKDPYSNKKVRIRGRRVRSAYEKYVSKQEAYIEAFFQGLGISFLKLDTSKSFVDLVIRFFNERKSTLITWK